MMRLDRDAQPVRRVVLDRDVHALLEVLLRATKKPLVAKRHQGLIIEQGNQRCDCAVHVPGISVARTPYFMVLASHSASRFGVSAAISIPVSASRSAIFLS
jgi:hypothetical protein